MVQLQVDQTPLVSLQEGEKRIYLIQYNSYRPNGYTSIKKVFDRMKSDFTGLFINDKHFSSYETFRRNFKNYDKQLKPYHFQVKSHEQSINYNPNHLNTVIITTIALR